MGDHFQHTFLGDKEPAVYKTVFIFEQYLGELENKATAPRYVELWPGIKASIATLKKYYIYIDDSDMAVVSMGKLYSKFLFSLRFSSASTPPDA